MVKENNREYMAQVKGNGGMSPLLFAVIFRREEMVYWLYYLTKASLNHADRIELLLALIRTGFHETEIRRHIKLYRAALRGDWKYVIDSRNITAKLSEKEDTALHIGAMAKSCKFAGELLRKLDRLEDLVVRNKNTNTAFCLAAASGKLALAKEMILVAKKMVKDGNLEEEEGEMTEVVKEMVKENNGEYLAQVKGNSELSPLLLAVLFGHEEMAYWLCYLTKTSLKPPDRHADRLALIRTGFHEFALQLLEEHKDLATAHDETEEKETALHVLAKLPVANQQGVWKRIKRCFNQYYTPQLLEKYNEETVSNQQGLWEKNQEMLQSMLVLSNL